MAGTTTVMAVALAVAAAVVALGVLKVTLAGGRPGSDSFKPKRLLTPNELEFLARLEAAVPELRFCPQVAMGALLEPTVRKSDSRGYYRQRGMFSQKIVDFVAQRRADGAVIAIIELDDRMHDSDKDAKRDAMLSSAGYRIVRWQSRAKPDAAAIRAALLPQPPQSEPEKHNRAQSERLAQGGDAARIEPTLAP